MVELKRVPPTRVKPQAVIEQGIEQLAGYLDQLDAPEGWLLVFDQRPGLRWEERLWQREVELSGRLRRVGA